MIYVSVTPLGLDRMLALFWQSHAKGGVGQRAVLLLVVTEL